MNDYYITRLARTHTGACTCCNITRHTPHVHVHSRSAPAYSYCSGPARRLCVGREAGAVRDSRSATTDRVMSQPRGPSGPWARAAGHCKRVLLGTIINVSRGLHCFFRTAERKNPRGQQQSIRCLTVQLSELWTRPICGGGRAAGHCRRALIGTRINVSGGLHCFFPGRRTKKTSRPAREHALPHRPAQRAVDPPPRGLQQAHDVPGSSTPTARTQSDVRSFRVEVWRIIIAQRAATSLDVGRAALQCCSNAAASSRGRRVCPCTVVPCPREYCILSRVLQPADPCCALHSTAGLPVARVEP